MIHKELKGKRLVFGVKDKPELGKAIVKRLRELGGKWACGDGEEHYPPPGTFDHLFINGGIITCGTWSGRLDFLPSTLSDLYDLKPTLQIKEGKYYRRRDGVVVGPVTNNVTGAFGSTHPWRASNYTYADNGAALLLSDGPSHLDLIEEVTTRPITLENGKVINISAESYAEFERGVA